ncbi:maltose/glucose-specific PTS transporter subunit IIBC [Fusobacterium sp. FSA-380-WT-3A]|uniref:maltose/glucose-specific PTS transporter subunit IIBC n=1 Tax=Fusobacterium sp. FSA-380-WT-3A TaxID=2725304 RepID=UPI001476AEE7|nr:maltose/glucose-specific PTS transporter subunit IIBC [Fusobacterium sp. FSA-380-WT-3A]NME35013.1 PTS maltose transporter subunit IICB [Fusobacterium sp. FSA-380-WT-3A]
MKNNKISAWEFFQSLGKTFMLPVALLAAMGILLGIGAGFTGPTTVQSFPFLGNKILQLTFNFMIQVSLVVFSYLPLLFAVAIPLGLARENKEIAAFGGVVGYIAMQLGINFHLSSRGLLDVVDTKTILGIQSIDTGVLGGLICGIIVFFVHEKFKDIELSEAFSFFGGTRFVAIASAVILSLVGLVVPFIWPYFASGISKVGYVIQKSGNFGPFLFGAGEVLLLPFGLHHILVALIRFTEAGGSYINQAGEQIFGALNIFYNQFAQGHEFVSTEATKFLSQGKMPSLIFGLAGVAFTIYKTSFLENRKKIKGLLISAVIASAIGGITEPILFLFLFIAPILYLFHAIMYGLGFSVMAILGVKIGNTDGNLIDFFVFGVLQGTWTKWYLVIPVGIVWFFAYYFVFKWYIEKHNIQTPGRDSSEESKEILESGELNNYTAKLMLEGLGGKDNLVNIDNCITRLRLTLNDATIIDVNKIKKAGAIDVVKLSNTNIQVIIGPKVQVMRKQIEKLL